MFNHQIAKPVYNLVIFLALLLPLSCTQDENGQKALPVGIWLFTDNGAQVSIEFKQNGSFLFMHERTDDIVLGRYVIDFQKHPWHLDMELINDSDQVKAIIEQVDKDTIRIKWFETEDIRPISFADTDGGKTMVLHPTSKHVRPQLLSDEKYEEDLNQALMMESIWFEGKNHKEILDICEALFRYQFTHNASGQQQNAPAYYLSIYETDPPKDLIERFQNSKPPVNIGSEFKIGSGLKFEINSINRLNKNNVVIEGGYYAGPLGSSGNTYHLQKTNGVWKVISDKINAFS
jgi:hypothetical protein